MAPVTDLGTLARRYAAIAAPVNRQLAAEIGNYNANQDGNLATVRTALQQEVTTDRSFDTSLTTWLAAWNKDYAAAKALQSNGLADADEPVIINIPYSSSVAKTARALFTAVQASESLITRQAQAGTLSAMRSLNGAHQAANSAAEAQAGLLRKELHLRSARTDKVAFGERGDTNGDLVGYYRQVTEPPLPSLGGGPVLGPPVRPAGSDVVAGWAKPGTCRWPVTRRGSRWGRC